MQKNISANSCYSMHPNVTSLSKTPIRKRGVTCWRFSFSVKKAMIIVITRASSRSTGFVLYNQFTIRQIVKIWQLILQFPSPESSIYIKLMQILLPFTWISMKSVLERCIGHIHQLAHISNILGHALTILTEERAICGPYVAEMYDCLWCGLR